MSREGNHTNMCTDLDQVTNKLIQERRKMRRILCRIKERIARNEIPVTAMAMPKSTINLLNPLIEANNLFKTIRLLSSYKRKPEIDTRIATDGSILSSNVDKANAFVNHFKKAFHKCNQLIHQTRIRLSLRGSTILHLKSSLHWRNEPQQRHLNNNRRNDAQRTSNKNKRSAGHDGIPNWLLRKLPARFYEELTVLFNA